MYKYTTQKSLIEIRGIAERAYTRGNKTCHVNVLALLAILDELKAAQHRVQADGASRPDSQQSFPAEVLESEGGLPKPPRQ